MLLLCCCQPPVRKIILIFIDDTDEGLAIFSDKANNIMTCYVDGKPWRTTSRMSYLLGRTRYEVNVVKYITNSINDTLLITWYGYPTYDKSLEGTITLAMPVTKNYSIRDLSLLEGKRISIKGNNGFFYSRYSTA